MNNQKPNNSHQDVNKDHKGSKNSFAKDILHQEFDQHIDLDEIEVGRNHENEEDHYQKRISGVKKGFCDQNKCDIYFE